MVVPVTAGGTAATVTSEDGEPVGTVELPDSAAADGSVVVVTSPRDDEFSTDGVVFGSVVVDITVFDESGRSITEFEDPIEICLEVEEDEDDGEACLGFYVQEEDAWECEDPCLKRSSDSRQLCGDTDHLTTFSILLDSTGGGNDPCDSSDGSMDLTMTILSAGSICLFGLLAVLIMAAYEIRVRLRKQKFKNTMTSIERNLGSVQAST